MAAPATTGTAAKMEKGSGEGPIPGYPDADSFVKHALGTVVGTTKASTGLPQSGDEHDFYRSFPGFRNFCESQADRLLYCMSRVMQYHGCRSHLRDRGRVALLEDKFDLLVDANDAVLERVGILLDEATGVHRNQQPILPAGLQAPKTIISSWNRKGGDSGKKGKMETFRLMHAKNILRPQIRFREKIDNSNTPFVPKIFIKPNAQKPLPEGKMLQHAPAAREALSSFLFYFFLLAHPYQYELDHFVPPEAQMEKPNVQPFRPMKDVPCHFVTTLDDLVLLNEKLLRCSEFALDLEHHSYRSFLGLTCLMQISTRTEDFIIDTLELRSDLYILNESFTDPAIIKVLHGSDSDIEWLQKDFGLYVVNMFDTHQASRLLNLGRNSLDHLLKLYCNVESNKKFQLADWRVRPLPEEMIEYARGDTHYLLYIYDRMRTDLLNAANGQKNLLQLVWQRSKDLCLKKFVKPIFTEDSYKDLYQKQKKHLNTQQLAAFRFLYAWRDKMARQEDESTGYVLPNHMLLKISEELPKEPQGIIACCNPVPPLVRQQINELSLLVQQAREVPLLKSEVSTVKKKGPMPNFEKTESLLFGPHDKTFSPYAYSPYTGAAVVPAASGMLFTEEEAAPERSHPHVTLLARATVSIFNDPDAADDESDDSLAKQKAHRIMASFNNPFRMFLPSDVRGAHASQAAKLDPNTKMFEISNRWKLVSLAQQEREAKAKEEAKQKRQAEKAAREQAQKEFKINAANQMSVREQAAEESNRKRERVASEAGAETKKSDKKRAKQTAETEEGEPAPREHFKPFDYSKTDFKVFAGSSNVRSQHEFDPNRPAQQGKHKNPSGKKGRHQQAAGNKSMSFTGKSDRGFRHSWPKR
ncbi:LOW QUALITY PROTEIN: exosome complex component 10 [Gastrophryne carolinensis]